VNSDLHAWSAESPRHITQENFLSSLIPDNSICTVRVDDETVLEHGSDEAFRYQPVNDIETGSTASGWYACRGNRTYERMQFSRLPYLLVLDCLLGWNKDQGPVRCPAQALSLDNTEYHLAAIIYGNGRHFCSTTMIQGGALFYDGMKQRKLQWLMLNKKELFTPAGYQISQVWYLKNTVKGASPVQQQSIARESMRETFVTSSRPLAIEESRNNNEHSITNGRNVGSNNSSAVTKDFHTTERTPQGRQRYPMGLSLGVVGRNGRAPVCVGCRQTIKRGSQRLLLTMTVNEAKFWTTTTSFHPEEVCIRDMDRRYQEEARALTAPLFAESPELLSNHEMHEHPKQRLGRKSVMRELSSSLGPAWTHSTKSRKRF
jgi:hypothetical protein